MAAFNRYYERKLLKTTVEQKNWTNAMDIDLCDRVINRGVDHESAVHWGDLNPEWSRKSVEYRWKRLTRCPPRPQHDYNRCHTHPLSPDGNTGGVCLGLSKE